MMKTIDLERKNWTLAELIPLARQEPVLLLGPSGEEYLLSQADDFEREVTALRNSLSFQRFLETRSGERRGRPIAELLQEVKEELAAEKQAVAGVGACPRPSSKQPAASS